MHDADTTLGLEKLASLPAGPQFTPQITKCYPTCRCVGVVPLFLNILKVYIKYLAVVAVMNRNLP